MKEIANNMDKIEPTISDIRAAIPLEDKKKVIREMIEMFKPPPSSDQYLYGQPTTTFFRHLHKRHTTFMEESVVSAKDIDAKTKLKQKIDDCKIQRAKSNP